MKTKKVLASLFLIVMVVLMFTACGKNSKVSWNTETTRPQKYSDKVKYDIATTDNFILGVETGLYKKKDEKKIAKEIMALADSVEELTGDKFSAEEIWIGNSLHTSILKDNKVYISVEDMKTGKAATVLTQAVVGTATNFGEVYGLAYSLVEDNEYINYSNVGKESDDNIANYLANNEGVLDLFLPQFSTEWFRIDEIEMSEAVAIDYAKFVINKHGLESAFSVLTDSQEEYEKICYTIADYKNDYLVSKGETSNTYKIFKEFPRFYYNIDDKVDIYPYEIDTDSARWYFKQVDVERDGYYNFMGEFKTVTENQEADFEDAKECLKGYIAEDIPSVRLYTDFSVQENKGAEYVDSTKYIKLYYNWGQVQMSLLHEYIHYLTVPYANEELYTGYIEAIAEYVSCCACENRMAKQCMTSSANYFDTLFGEAGIYGNDGAFDYRRYTHLLAACYSQDYCVDYQYMTIDSKNIQREKDFAKNPSFYGCSNAEAAVVTEYLVNTFGRDVVFDNWDYIDFKKSYGMSFKEIYDFAMKTNSQYCKENGIKPSKVKG